MQRLNFSISTLLLFFAISIQEIIGINLFGETNVTTPKIIRKDGYPVEEHQVTTEDGYILTMHRIPYSPKISKSRKRQPIFYQHGLLASSSDGVLIGPPDGLSYLLSDLGYDVWMGNSRGNRYSQKHVTIDPHSPKFWDFSWHEMGVYDLPASFDYISQETGVDKFKYIGHSQGATQLFAYCSIDPSCKRKVHSAFLLAPGAFGTHFGSPLLKILAPIFGNGDITPKIFGSFDMGPNSELFRLFAKIFCSDYSILQNVCADAFFFVDGPSNYFNKSLLPQLAEVFPSGASFKQLEHYLQGYNSGKFRQFNYGKSGNLQIYGSAEPPDYNLKNISIPLYIYYSENDYLANPKDVMLLVEGLSEGVVRNLYKVQPKEWNHLDYLYGMHVKRFVYDELLKDIKEEQDELK